MKKGKNLRDSLWADVVLGRIKSDGEKEDLERECREREKEISNSYIEAQQLMGREILENHLINSDDTLYAAIGGANRLYESDIQVGFDDFYSFKKNGFPDQDSFKEKLGSRSPINFYFFMG